LNELEYWQNKVHADANEFYNMCETLQCLPNIWVLYEWGNWLSPTFIPTKKRFNTAFFFTCLSQIPNSKVESNEIEDLTVSI
jgi:nucleoside diphosphate-linked moiety X motif protein 19